MREEELKQILKCLPHKHNALSSVSSTRTNTRCSDTQMLSQSCGQSERGRCKISQDRQPARDSVRDSVQDTKRRKWRRHLTVTSAPSSHTRAMNKHLQVHTCMWMHTHTTHGTDGLTSNLTQPHANSWGFTVPVCLDFSTLRGPGQCSQAPSKLERAPNVIIRNFIIKNHSQSDYMSPLMQPTYSTLVGKGRT